MPEIIDRMRIGAGAWLPDNKSFVYNRLQKLEPSTPSTEQFQKSRVYLHILGTDPEKDKAVWGYGVDPKINADPTLLPYVYIVSGSSYAIASFESFGSPNGVYYVAPVESIGQENT